MNVQNFIELNNINFKYNNDEQFALQEITFSIEKGEIFGLLGPSGAGKSTIQKILTKLIEDYQGEIQVFNQNLKSFKRDYYEKIGVSFELPNHYLKLTARENLDYFRSLYSHETLAADYVLDLVGLQDHGDKTVENFSKGMKNRLTLARSLLNDPEILFLDEPTAGLDPVNKDLIIGIMKTLKTQGTTIFLTTHDMQVVDSVCDRVGFIVDGQIKSIGTPDELKKEHGSKTVVIEYRNGTGVDKIQFELLNLATNEKFQSVLSQHVIESIHSQEATLDRVFIEVTGSALI